uniref:Uncharacterized protein n=1 Tax=Rhizophora mucronata TaxID=61149 RepID=A0A2P2N1J6_RHIMU
MALWLTCHDLATPLSWFTSSLTLVKLELFTGALSWHIMCHYLTIQSGCLGVII